MKTFSALWVPEQDRKPVEAIQDTTATQLPAEDLRLKVDDSALNEKTA
jgi:hypothetical protein